MGHGYFFWPYFSRYFNAKDPDRLPYPGVLSGVSRKDKARVKKWLSWVEPLKVAPAKAKVRGGKIRFVIEESIPEIDSITPFTVGEGVKRPILSLKTPKKPRKAKSDTAAIAARKAAAVREAKRRVEEEVLLLALI